MRWFCFSTCGAACGEGDRRSFCLGSVELLPKFAEGEFDLVECGTPFTLCSLEPFVPASEVEPFRSLGGRSFGGFLFGREALALPFAF